MLTSIFVHAAVALIITGVGLTILYAVRDQRARRVGLSKLGRLSTPAPCDARADISIALERDRRDADRERANNTAIDDEYERSAS